jgi:hypothetical protein
MALSLPQQRTIADPVSHSFENPDSWVVQRGLFVLVWDPSNQRKTPLVLTSKASLK